MGRSGHGTCPPVRAKGAETRMVLRCPRCSALKFFGRTQVLGELVVCPQCETVFRWGEAHTGEADAAGTPKPGDRSDGKRAKR